MSPPNSASEHDAADPIPTTIPPSWLRRLEDPGEPLYTVAVACDLLDSDPQTIRRLDDLSLTSSPRTSGNHRRYSRNDIATLAAALVLLADGVPRIAVPRLLAADDELRRLRTQLASAGEAG